MYKFKTDILKSGVETLRSEADTLNKAADRLGDQFIKAVGLVLQTKGRVIVTGMGKSGHIGKKISATLASTGTPSFFIHPAEAVHGDLGMITADDIVLALSYSGETDEIKKVLPTIRHIGTKVISITGNTKSTLAGCSAAVLDGSIEKEAGPLNLAPSNSTTLALALGDALAIALSIEKGFTPQDFAIYHPAGSLGKKLLLRVDEIWHSGDSVPVVKMDTSMKDLLYIMSSKGFGCTTVIDGDGKLSGIITDGDLRRGMEKYKDFNLLGIENLMSKNPKRIKSNIMAVQALEIMEESSITTLLVVNDNDEPVGIIHMHDLLKAGLK